MHMPNPEEIRRAIHKFLVAKDAGYQKMISAHYHGDHHAVTVEWIDRHGNTRKDYFKV